MMTGIYSKAFDLARSAASCRGAEEYRVDIAGLTLLLRFSRHELALKIMPAFAHRLRQNVASRADLTLYLFTEHEEGDALWQSMAASFFPTGEKASYYFRDGDIWGLLNPMEGARAFSLLDRRKKTAVFFVSQTNRIPAYELAAPLRGLLYAWLIREKGLMMHAAAVGNARGCVLIGGRGGAGKSNIALACLDSGLGYLGDDYVLTGRESPPVVYSVYATAKLYRDDFKRHPLLAGLEDRWGIWHEGKAVLFLHEVFPGKMAEKMPLRAVFVPQNGGDQPSLEKMPQGEALRVLAPSTLLQLPGAGETELAHLAVLLRRIPAYKLILGSQPWQVPPLIARFLEALPQEQEKHEESIRR